MARATARRSSHVTIFRQASNGNLKANVHCFISCHQGIHRKLLQTHLAARSPLSTRSSEKETEHLPVGHCTLPVPGIAPEEPWMPIWDISHYLVSIMAKVRLSFIQITRPLEHSETDSKCLQRERCHWIMFRWCRCVPKVIVQGSI